MLETSLFLFVCLFVYNHTIIIHYMKETDADPHDARRGFFFAHVGWLFLTPHPEVVAKRKAVDMHDLENDPIVMWQKRLYIPLFALLAIAMPVLVDFHLFYFFVFVLNSISATTIKHAPWALHRSKFKYSLPENSLKLIPMRKKNKSKTIESSDVEIHLSTFETTNDSIHRM